MNLTFWRRRKFRQPAAPAPVSLHACTEADAWTPSPSPLITELLATVPHTRQITWLAERETCADEYQLIARTIVSHLLTGWQAVTHGEGQVEDLLVLPTGAPRSQASVPDGLLGDQTR